MIFGLAKTALTLFFGVKGLVVDDGEPLRMTALVLIVCLVGRRRELGVGWEDVGWEVWRRKVLVDGVLGAAELVGLEFLPGDGVRLRGIAGIS